MLMKKLMILTFMFVFTTQLQATTELITGGGTNSGEAVDRSAWTTFGSTYISQSRDYNGKKFLYSAPKTNGSGLYQAFSTEIGKTYTVSATLLGADVNRNEIFNKASYLTISSALPTPNSSTIVASSDLVTGGTEIIKTFTFTAIGTTSYIAIRSSKAWNYANARAISVKEKEPNNPNNPCITLADLKAKIANDEDVTEVNTGCITDMSGLFQKNYTFNQDISGWDVSQVTNMDNMFQGYDDGMHIYETEFNQPIGSWDVSNVTSMRSMFGGSMFNQPIDSWDVSNVTNMSNMFGSGMYSDNARSMFNQPIDSWDVSNVTDMSRMFFTSKFNQDISSWDVSNVTNMNWMFFSAHDFNQNLSSWDVSKVTDMNWMFTATVLSTENYSTLLQSWSQQDLQSNVTLGAESTKYNESAIAARQSLIDTYGWTINDAGLDTTSLNLGQELIRGGGTVGEVKHREWNTLGRTYGTSDRTYYNEKYLYASAKEDKAGMYQSFPTKIGQTYLVLATLLGTDVNRNGVFLGHNASSSGESYITISSDIPTVYESSMITSSDKKMGYGEKNVQFTFTATSTTSYIALRSTTAWRYASARAISIKELNPEENPENPCITREELMTKIANYEDVTHVNTGCITNMSNLFKNNQNFNQDISSWDVSNVTDMSWMFFYLDSFNQDISSWNVSNVMDMGYMFQEASSFNQDISSWDVSHVKHMEVMFSGAKSFNQNLSSWDISNVTHMHSMFNNSALSTANYDALLQSWSQLDLQQNVVFDARGIQYREESIEARQNLIDIFSWTITDGGLVDTSTGEELIVGGGNDGNEVQHTAWLALGDTYHSQTRTYNGKTYIYATAKEYYGGRYQSFPTEVGKTYVVSAILLGADVNRNELFNSPSYITVESTLPHTYPTGSPTLQHNGVMGSIEKRISFEFTATSTTSYISIRSANAWHYANARAISVKEKI